MTKLFALLVTFFATLALQAQNFEGQITYRNSYKSKTSNISDEQWTSMLGSEQHYLIAGGSYRSNTNGKLLQWQLYVNNENRLYTKLANSEVLLWNDGGVNPDEVLSSEIKKGVTEILCYSCDELTLTCKSGVQKYYFAPSLQLDSALFEKHKYGNWADFTSRARALPLKIMIENTQFTMESMATKVKPGAPEPSLFLLPEGSKTAKSPY